MVSSQGRNGAPGRNRASGGEGFHEGLLRGILGVVGAARDDPRRPEGDLLVDAQERLERRDVPSACPLDEVGFDRLTTLHRPSLGDVPAGVTGTSRWTVRQPVIGGVLDVSGRMLGRSLRRS